MLKEFFSKEEVARLKKSYSDNNEIQIRDREARTRKTISSIGVFQRIGPALKKWKNNIKKYNSFLDLGCGIGYWFTFLELDKYKKKVGVDFSPESILTCKKFFKDEDNCFFYTEDILEFLKKADTNQYDVVTAFGVIEHIPDRNKVLTIYKEMGRVAKNLIMIANYSSNKYKENFFVSNKPDGVILLYYFRQPMIEFIKDVEESIGMKITNCIEAKMYNIIVIEKNIP